MLWVSITIRHQNRFRNKLRTLDQNPDYRSIFHFLTKNQEKALHNYAKLAIRGYMNTFFSFAEIRHKCAKCASRSQRAHQETPQERARKRLKRLTSLKSRHLGIRSQGGPKGAKGVPGSKNGTLMGHLGDEVMKVFRVDG